MSVIPMMIFASLMLAVGSLLLFGYSLNNRDHQHSERLARSRIAAKARETDVRPE